MTQECDRDFMKWEIRHGRVRHQKNGKPQENSSEEWEEVSVVRWPFGGFVGCRHGGWPCTRCGYVGVRACRDGVPFVAAGAHRHAAQGCRGGNRFDMCAKAHTRRVPWAGSGLQGSIGVPKSTRPRDITSRLPPVGLALEAQKVSPTSTAVRENGLMLENQRPIPRRKEETKRRCLRDGHPVVFETFGSIAAKKLCEGLQ
jgi:hypothetical protein